MKVKIDVSETSAFEKPDVNAPVVFVAKQGQDLAVLSKDKNGKWFLVQGPKGKRGWIPSMAVGDPGNLTHARGDGAIADSDNGDTGSDSGDTGSSTSGGSDSGSGSGSDHAEPAPPGHMVLRAGAGFGFGLMSLDYGTANTTADGSAAGIALAGEVLYPLTSSIWVGGDATYLALQGFGFSYTEASAAAVDVGFRVFDLDLAAKAGYAVTDDLSAWLRAGVYYNSLFVTDIGPLPREQVYGPSAGVGVAYQVTDTLGASAQFSMMFAGSRGQTATLEDGAETSSASALWGRLLISYRLTADYVIDAGYRYLSMSTEWSGANNHIAGQMNTTRDDTAHIINLGLHTAF